MRTCEVQPRSIRHRPGRRRIPIARLSIALLLLGGCGGRDLPVPVPDLSDAARFPLTTGWEFQQEGEQAWLPAAVPGCVHTDLLAAGAIPDPFWRDVEPELQWIGQTEWVYLLRFRVDGTILNRQRIDLVFEGLDTYADVRLNGEPLLQADNMFRTWRAEVGERLRPGANELRIRFRSPIQEILPRMEGRPWQLPASNDQGEKTSPYTRKAPYHFGWDWGPRYVTCGIWRPVYLEAWDGPRIADLHLHQISLEDERADLTAVVEIDTRTPGPVEVAIRSPNERFPAVIRTVELEAGTQRVEVGFVIPDPDRWWPNGLGDQTLYGVRCELQRQGRVLDRADKRIGLRMVELRREPDAWGESFAFAVNGVPVFAKGGNWIPADSFPSRMTPERYRDLLTACRDANMNMLRVWGGGIYERPEFYDLCDELGLMIWQDFMFACSMYPGDEAFLENVRQEATEQVRRLRDHPSLVLWCGNNEIETAWQHWGWKQDLPASVWEDYLALFHRMLPEVVAEYDPARPYWPSSPSSDLREDPDSPRMGDGHYWGVWHGEEPFEAFEQQYHRFLSEFGFQSFPAPATMESYTLPEDRDIDSEVMRAHQKHPRGNQLIRTYLLRRYPEPKDFTSFLYLSQVLQSEGMRIAVEHLRRHRPRTMGALYWQVDDCWPVASWSGIDYFGRWKALQYDARRFFAPVLVSPHTEGDRVTVWTVSDLPDPLPARLRVRLRDLEGRVLREEVREVTVGPTASRAAFTLSRAEWLAGLESGSHFLDCELLDLPAEPARRIARNLFYFTLPREARLPDPGILSAVTVGTGGITITLQAHHLARDVHLEAEDVAGRFSDDFFDLVPGEQAVVHFEPRIPVSATAMERALRVTSLFDAVVRPER
jgi:beta-mannosidase